MNASISVVCYKSKKLSNGEHPLMLQICKDGKRKYQSLGISINPDYWDFKKNKPKPNSPNVDLIQNIILSKETELHRRILDLNLSQSEYTAASLLKNDVKKIQRKTVGEFYSWLINKYETNNERGNRKIYKDSLNSIKSFSNGYTNFYFIDIDIDWLLKYEFWMRSKGNKETTISLKLRTLRSAYNKAMELKCVNKNNYPFDEYKINKFDVTTKKRALSKTDVIKIINMNLSHTSFYTKLSRDIFVFSYLCGGINFTDIANLTNENIIDNRLQYVRQKTGKKINLLLSNDANRIIDSYNQNDKSNYIFPILNDKMHKTATQKENRIHKVLGKVNKQLKYISNLLGMNNVNLTTYVARHSFATILKKSGVNISLISETLGHTDIATTQIYLDSFDNNQIDDALKNLL